MKYVLRFLLFTFLFFIYLSPVSAGETKVAAASSLTFALDEIIVRFEERTGHRVRVSYSSSGILSRQIEQGAPYELFLSADQLYTDYLAKHGMTRDRGVVYTLGQLALFEPGERNLILSEDLSALDKALTENAIQHFSIPNPELAPYGRIAREALIHSGLWSSLQPFLIMGQNASQTARFLATGIVDGALLPHSLAIILEKKGLGHYQLVSHRLYQQLQQRMVLMKNAGEVANVFYEYLLQPDAQKIFEKYGFGSVR